ncbi:MAG: hypothetical protein ACJ8AO_09255 [Gemmatimonadaceae bacterium]
MEVETTPGEGASEYYYRRRLEARDLLPALGVGVGVGLVAFYLARVLMQRTPLLVPRRAGGTRAQQEEGEERLTDPARERPAPVLPRVGQAASAEGEDFQDMTSGGVRMGPEMMGHRTMSSVRSRGDKG